MYTDPFSFVFTEMVYLRKKRPVFEVANELELDPYSTQWVMDH